MKTLALHKDLDLEDSKVHRANSKVKDTLVMREDWERSKKIVIKFVKAGRLAGGGFVWGLSVVSCGLIQQAFFIS